MSTTTPIRRLAPWVVFAMVALPASAWSANTVILVVDDLVLPQIQTEVTRLQADLTSEGYSAKIKSWTTATQDAVALWNYLKSEYTAAGQTLKGAILIGCVPMAKGSSTNETTDLVFWNMTQPFGNTFTRNIWVSRMWALYGGMDPFAGSEVALLKRALQANHDVRTGAARLPNGAYYWSSAYPTYFDDPANMSALQTIWPSVQQRSPNLAFVEGGDCMQEESHGGPGAYDSVNWFNIHDLLGQLHAVVNSSCSSGYPGGVVNNQLLTRGGHNVLSIGASNTAYSGQIWISQSYANDVNFRGKLAAGYNWGDALVASFPFEDCYRLMFYGDLSIRAKPVPSNVMPIVNSLTANRTSGSAPLSVSFSASASDPDGSIANYEWFPEGHGYGKVNPVVTGATATAASRTYTLPHRYLARVEVTDNFKARSFKEVEIDVAPTPGQPLRVSCGKLLDPWYSRTYFTPGLDYVDSQGRVWLHDQPYVAGTWGGIDANNPNVWQFDTFGNVGGTAGTQADRNALYHSVAGDYFGTGFSYKIPLADGGYTVNLGFADMLNTLPGKRLTDAFLNGTQVLTAFDAVAAFGAKTAGLKSFHVTVAGGMLTITIKTNPGSSSGQGGLGFLNCFEVLPDTGTPNQAPVILSAPWANPNPITLPASTTVSVVASDPDSGPAALTFTWSKVSGPGSVTFSPNGTAASASSSASFSTAGVYTLRITVSDGAAAVTDDVVVTVNASIVPPTITSALNATGTAGTSFSYAITASNSPTSFNAAGLPSGLAVNASTGLISGTPSAAGTSNVTLSATNAGGTGTSTLVLTINSVIPKPVITSALTATGTVGSAFSYAIIASNNPTSFNATGLPAGLAVNSSTGLISGTPSAAGTSNVILSASNAGGTGTATLTLTVTLTGSGALKSWGVNSYGQLGDGTTTTRSSPINVPGLSGVQALACGSYHTVALMNDGTVKAWGDNTYNQLGTGGASSLVPVTVPGLSGVKAIAAGGYHTLAVMNDGTLKAWGYNGMGALGDGTVSARPTPVAVTGVTNVKAVAGGWYHSLAVLTDGTVKTWGWNANGQLGNGTTTQRSSPAAVSGVSGAVAVGAGLYHSLVVLSNGTMKAWGNNNYGQLGDGTTTQRLTPVAVAGMSGAKSVSGGNYFSLALLTDGTVKSWGYNGYGQLGDGTVTQRNTPVTAVGLSGVGAVSAGYHYALAVMLDGTLKTWGNNVHGELGDGMAVNTRSNAVAVPGVTGVTNASAGASHVVCVAR